jgi:hypothetical protein
LETFEQTHDAALHRCKRLLPENWLVALRKLVDFARRLLPGARSQLQLLQQAHSSIRGMRVASAAMQAIVAAQHEVIKEHTASNVPVALSST